MASIQKRGKKYAVVYTYDDSKGEKKQNNQKRGVEAESRGGK